MPIKDMPSETKPREKAVLKGMSSLSDEELLAIIIQVGVHGEDAIQLSKKLIKEAGGLFNLSKSQFSDLKSKGMGPAKKLKVMAAFELGRRASMSFFAQQKIKTSSQVASMNRDLMYEKEEKVYIVMLDKYYNLIRNELAFTGSDEMASNDYKELLKRAVNFSASYVYLVHNHPSGKCLASNPDDMSTRVLIELFKSVGIMLIDHIVIAKDGFYSIRDGQSYPLR